MKNTSHLLLWLFLLGFAGLGFAGADSDQAQAPNDDLATQARSILRKHCYRCHGQEFQAPGLDVLNREILTATNEGRKSFVAPGKPDDSLLWQRVGVEKDMPPEDEEQRPSPEQISILRRWIEAEAPFPKEPSRPFQSESDVLAAIRDHLLAQDETDRPFLRYFVLTNLHNNSQGVNELGLRLHRAAISKLINSLSWQEALVLPEPIDPQQNVLAIDLRKLGWDELSVWDDLMEIYPYALKHDGATNAALAALASEVYRLADCDLPCLRADWFLATASRPPLYYKILDLPEALEELTKRLDVNLANDFLQDRLLRAGIAQSGVSRQHRVLDRHSAKYGAFWITYDFKPEGSFVAEQPRRNVFRHPLGPEFDGHPLPDLAFQHDGGEMIFHLPNGMQGYYLTDAQGKRIEAGPIDVVFDNGNSSGTPEVVAGVSCMACHEQGLRIFTDRLALGMGVRGDARRKAERLIGKQQELQRLFDEDQIRFLSSLREACGPFLQVGDDQEKEIARFGEPIRAAALQFNKDLGPSEAAAELGLASVEELKILIRGNVRLQTIGLGPLLDGGAVKRDQWQSFGQILSQFQIVAIVIDRGAPFRPTRGPAAAPSETADSTSEKSSGDKK